MPGQLLPLWLTRRSELQTAEAALAAPKPLDRLLIVVSAPHLSLQFVVPSLEFMAPLCLSGLCGLTCSGSM